MDAASVVEDHDLDISNQYQQHDEDKFYRLAPHPAGFVGLSAPYPLDPQLAVTPGRPASEEYSFHPPGLGVALAPAWWIGSWLDLWWPATIMFMCLVGALVALNVFLLAYALTGRAWIAWTVWAALAFASPLLSYSLLIFSELPVGLLLIYAFRRLAHGWVSNNALRLVLIGLCIAYIPWLSWRCALISCGLLAYAAAQWWWTLSPRQRKAPWQAAATSNLAWLLAPIVLSMAVVVVYSLLLFGGPLPNGLLRGTGPPVFHWPWAGWGEMALFFTGAYGLLFDRQWGLLPFTPVYLLAAVGFITLTRTGRAGDRRLLLWILITTLPYAFVIAAFDAWHGLWCPPARYLCSLVPLLAAPLAMSLRVLDRSIIYRGIFAVLTLVGFTFMGIMLYDPRLMFPVERAHLLVWLATSGDVPWHIDLRPFIPAYAWPDPVHQPVMTARIIIISLLLVMTCASLFPPNAWGRRRLHHLLTANLMWSSVVIILAASWLSMNWQWLQPKALLVQRQQWYLQPLLRQPGGMTYLDGALFLTDYGAGKVYRLDLHTGMESLVNATIAGRRVDFVHPGDITVGAKGLLYLLNNGTGRGAVWVMRPGGTVVRQLPLDEKSPIALGIAIDRHGRIYVADTLAGRVRRYGPSGGGAQVSWRGLGRGFNNVTGVAVDGRRDIFAAESSASRVQVLDMHGRVLRDYKLACMPQKLVVNQGWVDVACTTQVVALDPRSGDSQIARQKSDDPPLVSPLAAASDGHRTLYILDSNGRVAAFSVSH